MSAEEESSWSAIIPKVIICIKTTVVTLILIKTFVTWFKLKDEEIKS